MWGRISRRNFVALAGTTAASALGFELPSAAAPAPKSGGTVVIGLTTGVPRHFNPALVSGVSTGMPGAQIFASPIRFDANWNPQPYLAQSWNISDDGLSVTLHLVEGATFHDGKPVTSEDVAFSLEIVKKYHPFKSMLAAVDKVDYTDPRVAVIHLQRPQPAILLCLSPALCPVLPKHVFGNGGDIQTNSANNAPIGSGPYKFVDYKNGELVTLEKYDNFFIKGRPYIDRILYRIVNDPITIVTSAERGDLHLVPYASSVRDVARLKREPRLAVTDKGYEGISSINWLAFNLKRPPLDDKRVRQAICYAIDKNFIIKDLLAGVAQRATGPISPSSPFYTADVDHFDFDLAKANALLDDAGHKRGADGSRLSLTIDYIPVPGLVDCQKNIANYLKPQLKKVGIDVQVRDAPDFATWAQRVGSWDYDMTMDCPFGWGDPTIGTQRTYESSNILKGVIWTNTDNYSNPKVDEVLQVAATEMNPQKRRDLYVQFQKIVVDDAPNAFLNMVPFYTIYDKDLANIPTSIWGAASPLDELYWEKAPG